MSSSGDFWAVILAAGSGTRLAASVGGVKKQYLNWKGMPLFWHSATTFSRIPRIKGLVFVFPPSDIDKMKERVDELNSSCSLGLTYKVVSGGERRQDSVFNGLKDLPATCSHVLIHDSARPFASASMISSIIDELDKGASGVVPAVKVTDTIKTVNGNTITGTPDRSDLRAVQTPQGFPLHLIRKAHEISDGEGWNVTDDASMLEMMGESVVVCQGEESNIKITNPEDLAKLEETKMYVPCVGWGYDVHRYGSGRPMVLGGIPIPGGPEVVAHSDGDVLYHALADAILGLFGGGDIGLHFPDTDAALENMSSGIIVMEALSKAEAEGIKIVHADLTVIAQIPKLAPYREQIRKNVASVMGLPQSRVNVKATTEEKLGFTGEKKGIKAVATVTGVRLADVDG
ncbi:2-C-methyl-D-erythritol 4-phosphate cytidylyltransferase [Maridesulfovibrio bastinii]|uniref:2-C-methyl-D-erythritol 4-phosphate cytidylyltransferase n=1 Tax=Maridesulfovibrio bastinii TaxID=47157 RepID=UPI0004208248|nr:2-C-methyl-D-erythritol 4-phosphate cytidylyltransferase [Maridesulfovibrio bastinii]